MNAKGPSLHILLYSVVMIVPSMRIVMIYYVQLSDCTAKLISALQFVPLLCRFVTKDEISEVNKFPLLI